MLRNYFKVAFRNIVKHKFYAILNIAGLAFGLTACFLIGLYISDELLFDRFHKDYQNIYHVGLHAKIGGQEFQVASSCPPLAGEMSNAIPGVEQAIRIKPKRSIVVKYEDKFFTETKVLYVDSNFFAFFSFDLLEGDPKTVLKEPSSIVITHTTSVKYFGDQSALGKIIVIGKDNEAFKVTGIVQEAPVNSHIQFDMLLSAASDKNMMKGGWGDNDATHTYFRKNPKTKIELIDQKLRAFVEKHIAPELEDGFGISFKEFEKQGGIYSYYSYPMSSSHLYYPDIQDNLNPVSDIKYVYIISAVGIFILLIACINFMNLSTARSASRAKEVGLRKTLGSARSRLVIQFLSESFIYVFGATIIAIAGVYFLLPSFNLLSGKVLLFNAIFSPIILGSIFTIFITVSLLAGSYPALYLTSFNPIDVLKGNVRSGMKSKGIRSSLVVVQFSISIALIICTTVVYNQLSFLQEKNIGLDKQNVLAVKNTNRLETNADAFLVAITGQAGVENASFTNIVFPGINDVSLFRPVGTKRDLLIRNYAADYNNLNVLKIDIVQGRYFSKDFPSDSAAIVINEATVKELGWSNPLKEKLTDPFDQSISYHVVGVVKDFNFESFKTKVNPLLIHFQKRSNNILIRYNGNPKEAVASIETLWKRYAANEPFEYSFLDENFDLLFREDQRLGQLFTVLSGIAIFVACLGLLGLASFTAEQRTREIGIRKVMGASVQSINTMLSREFMILVGISFIIAAAFAWYAMHNWLDTFAYRIRLGPTVFLLSGLLATVIAWLTVSYHFIKAARSNPVHALRSE
ncbi:MAG: FtsX-like permease family protein [Cyclobacteriaceae bacterium]|nr:FtsX-like permease family protein [Cyclobacteriaceae bacterium]